MSETMRHLFGFTEKKGGIDRENKTVAATISAMEVDRMKDVVDPAAFRGAGLKNFKKSPSVFLGHMSMGFPVGTGVIEIESSRLRGITQFATELDGPAGDIARSAWSAAEQRVMRSWSIGFIGKTWITDPETIAKKLEGKVKNFEEANRLLGKGEMVEYSLVGVAASPSSVTERSIVDPNVRALLEFGVTKGYDWTNDVHLLDWMEKSATFLDDLTADVKTLVPYRRFPLADRDRAWDGAAARRRAAGWASGGDPDDLDLSTASQRRAYAPFYVWVRDDGEARSNYIGPHHDVVDGEIKTVWRGVTSLMAAILGARGGVNASREERREMYGHVARHYEDFEEEPPEFRSYEQDELRSMFPEVFEMSEEEWRTFAGEPGEPEVIHVPDGLTERQTVALTELRGDLEEIGTLIDGAVRNIDEVLVTNQHEEVDSEIRLLEELIAEVDETSPGREDDHQDDH